jgi:hypothetical protein
LLNNFNYAQYELNSLFIFNLLTTKWRAQTHLEANLSTSAAAHQASTGHRDGSCNQGWSMYKSNGYYIIINSIESNYEGKLILHSF